MFVLRCRQNFIKISQESKNWDHDGVDTNKNTEQKFLHFLLSTSSFSCAPAIKISCPLIVLVVVSLLGTAGDVRAMLNEEERDNVLFASVKALANRFANMVQEKPGVPSKNQVILQGRFLPPLGLNQEQAREILGLNEYGHPLVNPSSPFYQHFEIRIANQEDPLPISQSISHSIFHTLLAEEDGALPTTLVTLKNVQIFSPSSGEVGSGPSKKAYFGMHKTTYHLKPYSFAVMIQPRVLESLKEKLSLGTFNAKDVSPSQLGSLVLSSFLTHPETLAENFCILPDSHGNPSLFYDSYAQVISPAPVCLSKAGSVSKHFLAVKNALYLLPEVMSQEIDPTLKSRLLNLDPSLFLLQWIAFLKREDRLYGELLTKSGLDLDHRIELGFPLVVPPRLVENLLKSLTSMKEALKVDSLSYQSLLETLFPLVAYSYQTLGSWERLALVRTEQDSTGRITPAKSLEELLDLNGTLVNGKGVFEVLEEERFPMGGGILIQSLDDAAQKIIQQFHLKQSSPKDQVVLLSLLANSFKDQVLKLQKNHKLQGFEKGVLDELLYLAQDQASIELLFELGANPKTTNAQKETPLHARIKLLTKESQETALPLLAALAKGTVDINAENEAGKTVIDLTLEQGLDIAFTRLVGLAAEQWKPLSTLRINTDLLLTRYDQWVEEGRENQDLKKAFDTLCKMSPQIAWKLSLREILPAPKALDLTYESLSKVAQKHLNTAYQGIITTLIAAQTPVEMVKQTLETFLGKSLSDLQSSGKKIQTTFMGERVLLPETESQLFDDNGQVKRTNMAHGRRDVARVELHGKILYFKHLPELPGFEYAMHLLHQKLIGCGTPPSELIKIDGKPFLVSLGIEGQNLEDVLRNTPELLTKLEPQSLSALILMTMLTNPEDGKADNYILEPLPFQEELYRLVCVDNDHSLTPTLAKTTTATRLQVKSILYCLDQMKDSVSKQLKEIFYQFDPYKILKEWLEELALVNKAYENLFSNDEAKKLVTQGCVTCIPFKTQMMTQLYDKMVRLQGIFASKKPGEAGNDNKGPTHQEVLEKLEPLLERRYKIGFVKPQSVAQRFEQINGLYYNRNATGGYVSTISSGLLLQTLGIPAEESLIDVMRRGGTLLNVATAIEELEAIRKKKDKAVLGGQKAVKRFGKLKSENARATFLSRFDFSQLDQAQQQAFLRLLKESDPRSLTFQNCTALTTDILIGDIGIENLTRLSIHNNSHLDDQFIKALETNNSCLTSLTLENLSALTSFKGNFSKLTSLTLRGCPNLKSIEITAPNLKKLVAPNCPMLNAVNVSHPTLLRFLDLRGSIALTDDTLDTLLGNHPKLKILNVMECSSVSFPEIRSINPTYPVALLKAADAAEVKKLSEYIAQLLQQKNFEGKALDLRYSNIGDVGITALSEALKVNTTLQQLYLWNSGAKGARALGEALKVNATLQHLGLRCNYIRAEGTTALSEALKVNASLQKLYLENNNIGAEGTTALSEALKVNASLQKLYLENNNIGDDGAIILSEALKVNTTLQQLDLNENNIGDVGTTALGEALKVNTTLQRLILVGNKIRAVGVAALSEALKVNTALQQLYLGDNKIGDESARALGEALKVNTTLKQLDLAHNNIGDRGATALSEALKVNTTLQQLGLTGNKIGTEGTAALSEALKVNTTLRQLGLRGNGIGHDLWRSIQSLLERTRGLAQSSSTSVSPVKPVSSAPSPIILKGQSSKISFTFSPGSQTSLNLFEIFDLDRGHCVQQLLALKNQKAFLESLAPDIKFAFLQNLLPSVMQSPSIQALYQEVITGQAFDFEERLNAYVKDPATYHHYVRFALGKDVPLQHHLHGGALKLMGTLYRLSYILWQKPPHGSQLIEIGKDLHNPPIRHILYHPPVSDELSSSRFGRYELLKETSASGTYDFPSVGNGGILDNNDEPEIAFPWLTVAAEEEMVINPVYLFAPAGLADLSPSLRSLLELLKTSTHDLIYTPGRLKPEETSQLAEFLKTNKTLTKIILPSCAMGDEGAKAWATLLEQNTSLTFLSLPNNKISHVGIEALRQALQSNKTLLQLRLTHNPGLDAKLEKDIQDLLSRNQGLQYAAYLKKKKSPEAYISEIGAPGMRLLLKEISGCSFLKTVNLNFIPLYEVSTLGVLKDFLNQTPYLEKLTLLDAQLTDSSLEELIPSLVKHPHLRFLDLRGNHFKENSIKELVERIEDKSNICHLDLRWNPIQESTLVSVVDIWKTKDSLKVLELDLPPESPLQEKVGQLSQTKQGRCDFPLKIMGSIQQTAPEKFTTTLRGKTEHLKLVKVPGDGNCGYSSLQITRGQAADKLLEHINDPLIQRMLGTEIEDNFALLLPALRTQAYRNLQARVAAIDSEKTGKITKLNDALERPSTDRWDQNKLLKECFTPSVPLTDALRKIVQPLMHSLVELTLKEEQLEQDRRDYCADPETLKLYIEHYIRPNTAQYREVHGESNWLQYSPQLEHGYYRFSSADALARLLGKNLAIWAQAYDQAGNPITVLSHEYHWNPAVETAHLLHSGAHSYKTGNNHFDRLERID